MRGSGVPKHPPLVTQTVRRLLMAKQTLVNWLLDFCDQLEGVQPVQGWDDYAQGMHDGSRITQEGIAKKLRYAAEQEKKRLTKRAPDGAKRAAKKGSISGKRSVGSPRR